jgi:hypothetical protein
MRKIGVQVKGLTAPEGVTLKYVTAEEYRKRNNMTAGKQGWSVCSTRGHLSTTAGYAAPHHCTLESHQWSINEYACKGDTILVCPPRDHPLYPRGEKPASDKSLVHGCSSCKDQYVAADRSPCKDCFGDNWQPKQEKSK